MLLLSITLCIYLPLSRTTQHNTTAASTVWVLLLTFLVVDLSSIPLHFFEPSSFGFGDRDRVRTAQQNTKKQKQRQRRTSSRPDYTLCRRGRGRGELQ